MKPDNETNGCGGRRLVSMGPGVKGLKRCPGCRDCRPAETPSESLWPAQEAREAHHAVCEPCRTRTAPTGSGCCIVGFRLFLDWSHEVQDRAAAVLP